MENVLLAHEQVRNFHKGARFFDKLDIQKVYDSVSWSAVITFLI